MLSDETYGCAGCGGEVPILEAVWWPQTKVGVMSAIAHDGKPYCCPECRDTNLPRKEIPMSDIINPITERIRDAHSILVIVAIEGNGTIGEAMVACLCKQQNDLMVLVTALIEYREARHNLDLEMDRANLHRLNVAEAMVEKARDSIFAWSPVVPTARDKGTGAPA